MDLSVIIPTRNRSRRVSDLLDSLNNQEKVDFEWEVLVIDNNSTDDTKYIVEKKIKSLNINIRYIFENKIGLHHGRHRGAKEAKGEFLGYLDDDMILNSKWIQGINLLLENKADAVVGKILPKWEKKPPKWLLSLTNGGVYGYLGILNLGDSIKEVNPFDVFGGNSFIKKELVFKLGGYHPDGVPKELIRYRGDGETAFMEKFKQAGYKSYYDPTAIAYHIISSDRITIEYICKRAYNQGISNSFSSIRKNGLMKNEIDISKNVVKIDKDMKKNVNDKISIFQKIKNKTIKQFLLSVFNKIKYEIINISELISEKIKKEKNLNINKINIKIEESYNEGFKFHQNEVRKDPELLKWVLKENYFD